MILRLLFKHFKTEWAVLAPFGVFCFVYPFALFLLSFDLMPFGMEWMSSLLLVMLGLTAGAWMRLNFGVRGIVLSVAIACLGLALEYLGVNTGFPFGRYSYTGVLAPGLPGGVPLAIAFAWLLIIVSGLFTARAILGRLTRRIAPARMPLLVVLTGALLAVGLDLLLEPVAFRVKGYWLWAGDNSGYYGVPLANFAAWFAAALLLNWLVAVFLPKRETSHPRWLWVPSALYGMNVLLFGAVNLAHGFWLAALTGLVILVALYFTLFRRKPFGR